MPDGGKLCVRAFIEENDTVITVEDTGCGIPESVGPKLFTALFTTKSKGQGFIAHELQAVVPDCVTGQKDAVDAEGKPVYQGVDTSFLVATLTAAIQELKAEVDSLKAQLAAK